MSKNELLVDAEFVRLAYAEYAKLPSGQIEAEPRPDGSFAVWWKKTPINRRPEMIYRHGLGFRPAQAESHPGGRPRRVTDARSCHKVSVSLTTMELARLSTFPGVTNADRIRWAIEHAQLETP